MNLVTLTLPESFDDVMRCVSDSQGEIVNAEARSQFLSGLIHMWLLATGHPATAEEFRQLNDRSVSQ